jgi:ribosomal protein S18 acetylase RimI-like enzyme
VKSIEIIPFESQYSSHFYDLNVEWLEKYFYVEPYDKKVLNNPQEFIIDKGGFIFFVKHHNEIIGTLALINQGSFYELSKMAVSPKHHGLKIGQQLMDYCIDFARQQKWDSITLYSHRKLVPAITLYKKVGFKEVKLEKDVHYERADIKMKLEL